MTAATSLRIENLTETAVIPFGWMLGKPFPTGSDAAAFCSPGSDFWHEHIFSPGDDGETEILWVKYRQADPAVARLEMHYLTQQAVIPVSGRIIQVVATALPSGEPDLATLRAFAIEPGQGICMKPGTWHATRTTGGESTCLMLTRRSTTADLVRHLNHGTAAAESRLADIAQFRLTE